MAGGLTCGEKSLVRDFLRPLEKMAPIQEPPESGKLPFGPKGMRLGVTGAGLTKGGLIVGDDWIGFSLGDEAIQQVRRLDWLVETELVRVNRKGETVASVATKRRKLGVIQGSRIDDFVYRVSGNPSFYRVDIRFYARSTGRLLGEYSTYARVMKPRLDLRVRTEDWSVEPGEMASARLINHGTVQIEAVAYDYGFIVQAFTGDRWITIPDNPPLGRVPKRMQILPAGTQVRECIHHLVPSTQAPGLFRFASFGADGELLLAAEFEVVAAS
jgi:hypothetical protein